MGASRTPASLFNMAEIERRPALPARVRALPPSQRSTFRAGLIFGCSSFLAGSCCSSFEPDSELAANAFSFSFTLAAAERALTGNAVTAIVSRISQSIRIRTVKFLRTCLSTGHPVYAGSTVASKLTHRVGLAQVQWTNSWNWSSFGPGGTCDNSPPF